MKSCVCRHELARVYPPSHHGCLSSCCTTTTAADKNAFHNFYHGVSVMQVAFLFLSTTNAASSGLSRVDVFSTLVAALCHDIDHPGHNNTFEVRLAPQRD